MGQSAVTFKITPPPLADALQLALALTPGSRGQQTAQREMANALENAFGSRRQRLIASRPQVNLVKWSGLFVQAICILLAIAIVHRGNRLSATIALGIFATAVAIPVC